MQDAKLYRFPVAVNSPAAYDSGIADGRACRTEAGTPPIFVRVAIGDAYCDGFRTGYYLRGPGRAVAAGDEPAIVLRHRPNMI